MDRMDRLVSAESLDHPVDEERMVPQDHEVRLVRRVHLVSAVQEVLSGQRGKQDQTVNLDGQAQRLIIYYVLFVILMFGFCSVCLLYGRYIAKCIILCCVVYWFVF